MRIIGLTGPSGVGKSTMADCAKALGYFVIDCDRTAARVTENPALLGRLEAAFGGVIKNGALDRAALAAKAFASREATERLNEIMLPVIKEEIVREIEAARGKGNELFLLDAPTLFESGLDQACDAVIAVLADRAVRSKRIQNRDGLSGDALEKRLKAAQEDSFYLSRTGHIIYNNGDREEFQAAAGTMLAALSAETAI